MSHPDPSKTGYAICDRCGKEINNPDDIMYPNGHHGEPVECLRCYTSASDSIYESYKETHHV